MFGKILKYTREAGDYFVSDYGDGDIIIEYAPTGRILKKGTDEYEFVIIAYELKG